MKRAVFVTSHPAVAGLFGKCTGYYATVEAQGRGTLLCHMLVWVENHPNPERLRQMIMADEQFETLLFQWMEDL